jgi:DNA-binding PadR family transcriptional regulator
MNTPVESKSQDRELTTTSYAVLSILALRDHSTYDIARQMAISMHYMWPRAESNVYAEPRRLVHAGLATAREEWNGSRRRSVYSITDAGREAIARWLAAPSSPSRYESEACVKVFFAENGTVDDMVATIRGLGEESAAVIRLYLSIANQYAAGDGQYPQRFGLSGIAARLLLEQHAATVRWAEWAEKVVSDWETPLDENSNWGVATLRAAGTGFPIDEDAEDEGR